MSDLYTVLTVPPARKSFKKLPPQIRSAIVEKLQILSTRPMMGEPLDPPLQRFRSFHLSLSGSQYRVMYCVVTAKREVVVCYAGTRENFYKEARRLNLKNLA